MVAELKGQFIEIGDILTVGENNLKKQLVVFLVAAPVDRFLTKLGNDEFWQFQVLGEKVDLLKLNQDTVGKEAVVRVSINSDKVEMAGKPIFYPLNATLGLVKFISDVPAATPPAASKLTDSEMTELNALVADAVTDKIITAKEADNWKTFGLTNLELVKANFATLRGKAKTV